MTTAEQNLLRPVVSKLALLDASARVEVLEACAAALGEWSLSEYRAAFPAEFTLGLGDAERRGRELEDDLRKVAIPGPLALAALGQGSAQSIDRRRAGAYYTDYRLAQHLAAVLMADLPEGPVVDPACGSGMLLTAAAMAAERTQRGSSTDFVGNRLCGADLSGSTLRSARLAVAATVTGSDALTAVADFDQRLLSGDSLRRSPEEWSKVAPRGFAGVIGNPPWEKLKVNRHEGMASLGLGMHYGALYDQASDHTLKALESQKATMALYRRDVTQRSQLQGSGESDLYKLFLELALQLLGSEGHLAMLVPAGVIRSQGTENLRRHLFDAADRVGFVVHDNKAKYFNIDTRFKFLTLSARLGNGVAHPIELQHAGGSRETSEIAISRPVLMDRASIERTRTDLTLPEVRSASEWKLYRQLARRGHTLAEGPWQHTYVRELDMTNDKAKFSGPETTGTPLLEGRMVHQFRYRAKAYQSGTGRAARWKPLALGAGAMAPQFRIASEHITPKIGEHKSHVRAGFCDVTGQTNERTLLAAVIPPGVLCGNKVPTLRLSYPGLSEEDASYLWVAIATSLVVDWATRRLTTTSLNHFVLRSIPLPNVGEWDSSQAQRLISLSRQLHAAESTSNVSLRKVALWRAEIDCIVAEAFGLSEEDLSLVFLDFPLLDRGQPRNEGEGRSTVTRDQVMVQFVTRAGRDAMMWLKRFEKAQQAGAIAYIPEEYARTTGRQ